MRKLLWLVCFLLTLTLWGCATQIEPPADHPIYKIKSWSKRKVNLVQTTRWDIQGAVSITNRGKTQMGSFNWKQVAQWYAINISGPLNIGSIGIQGVPGQVTLYKPTGIFTAPTPEALMQQQLGWYLPISNMYYWVRGIPAPGRTGSQMRDEYGHLVYLQQQGWNIQFTAFQPQGDADLPRKIIMDNQQLHVKIVIKNWKLG